MAMSTAVKTLVLGGGRYTPNGARFVSTRIARSADLTGNADGKVGTVSLWFNNTTNSSNEFIYSNTSSNLLVGRISTNNMEVQAFAATVLKMSLATSSGLFNGSYGWHHLLASWDVGNSLGSLYIDGVFDSNASTNVNATLTYTGANHTFGATPTGTGIYTGDVAEFWMDLTTYLDLSNPQNVRKFITYNKKPVFLGGNGEKPLGYPPIVFMSGDATGFLTNKGTGGGFTTATGGLTTAPTSPGT